MKRRDHHTTQQTSNPREQPLLVTSMNKHLARKAHPLDATPLTSRDILGHPWARATHLCEMCHPATRLPQGQR